MAMHKNYGVTFSSLDPSQKDAFGAIVGPNTNLHIVHGPPGTGKSQLVVSLLERLASEDKKVLFVSQNTEALRVIERMIKRTEKTIGYPTDGKYVSLLDFCLMLYNPTHRQLKHLREQHTKISNKQLPASNNLDEPANIEYSLQYTNLDHEANYSIAGDAIGFDELVSYYIRYVTQTMAPEPLRNFEHVDVRAIFNALDIYAYKNHFSEFNKPRRELVLLSTNNPDLSLPNVRVDLRDIKDALSDTWTERFPAKESISVFDYLTTLKEYVSARQLLDIYKIATEGKSLEDLKNSLATFIAANSEAAEQTRRLDTQLEALNQQVGIRVKNLAHNSQKISFNPKTLGIVEADFENATTDLKRILLLTQQTLSAYPDITHVGLRDIWIGLAKDISRVYKTSVQDVDGQIGALNAASIDRLNKDLATYDAQNSVKRMVSGTPDSFKELLGVEGAKQLDLYRSGFEDSINTLGAIISPRDYTVASLLEIAEQPTRTPANRLAIKASPSLNEAKDKFLPLDELIALLNKYGIDAVNFDATKTQLREFSSGLSNLGSAISNSENKKLYLSTNLEQFIAAYNGSVDIAINRHLHQSNLQSQNSLQIEAHRQNAAYLVNITDVSDFVAKAEQIHEYLAHKVSSINLLLRTVSLPDDNMNIAQDLDVVERAINKALLSNNFSEYFFALSEGQTAADWLRSITALETYNNDAEVVDFVEHNKAVEAIRIALGIENKKYLDSILENDITFELFATRIVSALINECFGRAKMSQKKHVTTNDIIGAYDTFLKNQKTKSYQFNLQHIHAQSIPATKELSKQSTLQAGGKSTMDKFRHNTKTILEAFPIVCATPKDVSKYIAADKAVFDYVIFDEASQLLPGQAIPSMYRAKKAVIIGDPHQMPPNLNATFGAVEQSEDEFDDLGESILDLTLKQPQQIHHLKVHYRSKYNKLFEPSREAIYSDDGIEPIFEAELANGAPIDIIDSLGEELDDDGYDKNFYKICESIDEYLGQNNTADFCVLFTTNAVLTDFKNFIAETGERKFASIAKLYAEDKILLSTVTNCQGIEGVYTVIYMHHYSNPGMMWFFKEAAGAYKRLNVSITRQREGLKLLLADPRSHWIKACDEKLNRSDVGQNTYKSAQLMKSLLTNAGEQADTTYLDRKLGQNASWFDSPLTEQLFNKLTSHYKDKLGSDVKLYSEVGWNLLIPTGEGIGANERNVGFRIDIGVYSVSKKKFVLGIEMDGAMYHSGFDKEHSDYNRQKVLEDKGWTLFRIWSTNWLNDEPREFSRLIEVIDKKLA